MKIRQTFLITFLVVLVITAYVNTALAAKRTAFKPPRTEDQMRDWLTENNYEVKKQDKGLYAISWKQELPNGKVEDVAGEDVCKVLIESTGGKNTAHFTFFLNLHVNIDVIVASRTSRTAETIIPKWADVNRYNPKQMYRYHYDIENLSTSQKPVHNFQIYYSTFQKEWEPWLAGIDIQKPSGLWEGSKQLSLREGKLDSVKWESKDLGILMGESLYGFAFELPLKDSLGALTEIEIDGKPQTAWQIIDTRRPFQCLPGIITARVDVARNREKFSPTLKVDDETINRVETEEVTPAGLLAMITATIIVQIDGQTSEVTSEERIEKILFQLRPRGEVIGPEIIPPEGWEGWNALKLTQRLKTLTSQCVAEGWLDKSAAESLKQHLADIQIALQKAGQSIQNKQAIQAIQAFTDTLKQMEKEIKPSNPSQEPPLTQESMTLLKTNAEYLLTKF